MNLLKGKTAFITGTSRGIGRVCVEEFAAEGAQVIAHARRDSGDFRAWCSATAERYGVSIVPVFFDMTDTEAMKATVSALVKDRIPVNVLVNNAGIPHGGLFQMTSISKIREVFEVNLFSMMMMTQLLLRYMVRCGGGSIVNFSSVSGIDILRGNCAYGVSKAAVIAFTKTLAAECGTNGVRVNAVAPGLTATDMADAMSDNSSEYLVGTCAMQRKALPIEIAKVVVFLASDASSFVNGQVLRVDGGGGRV